MAAWATPMPALVVDTNDRTGVVDNDALMAVARVKQNLWRESWFGAIPTVGDPLGRSGRWLAGGDFTYATSRFRGNKNCLAGVWGIATDRHAQGADTAAYGLKLDYPNDQWDIALTYRYHWKQYRLEVGTAQKRRLYTQVTWWFGGFYDGSIDQILWTGAWNPTALLTVEFSGERNMARLPAGDFEQTLVGTRFRLNVSPDLSISSYVQCDTVSDSVGVNTRLRWTFRPEADVFVVYNHNVRSAFDRWRLDSNQLVMKVQYAWRV